ncbi:MAG: transposase, partial [Planctomycetaceae bacterium]
MASWDRVGELGSWIEYLSQDLDRRNRWRLAPLLGVLWATCRRTVARWNTAAGVSDDWQRYYELLWSVGRKAGSISRQLLRLAIRVIPAEHLGQFICVALDDTPTARYGPKVEGADIHRDPTPGPSGHQHLYGHVWVMLSWVIRHPQFGAIGLPIRSLLYIRRKTFDTPVMRLLRPWAFRTKLELAAELV